MTSGSLRVTMTTGFLALAMRLPIASLRHRRRALFSKDAAAKQRGAALVLALLAFLATPAADQALPLPRFASLKAGEVYMRAGPGQSYAVSWVFRRRGLPVEIVKQYEQWRYVRDVEGTEGWMHRVMLSAARTVIVTGTAPATGRIAPDGESAPVFRAAPGVQGELMACDGSWCRVRIRGVRGWLPMSALWGVYPADGTPG